MASHYQVEVTIISAKDLKNVNWRHGKLKPYAVVWVDPNSKCSTRVDDDGDTCPYWNDKLIIPFSSPIDDSTLFIDIVHAEDTKPLIGSAKLPLRDVGLGSRTDWNLELKRPSGRPQGNVEVSVSVRDLRYQTPDPHYASTTYGVPPPTYPAYGVPPPGYPAPLYNAYGAPPGYVEEKKSNFGGMGTGLAVGAVAGALGGIALAEVEDNIADDVADDLGYDGDDY